MFKAPETEVDKLTRLIAYFERNQGSITYNLDKKIFDWEGILIWNRIDNT